ncbi:MAG: glycosyltransferase [Oscillospiraceae bacterium]|nr:glycosyltransferase [Oscillospiraceae bacterium]
MEKIKVLEAGFGLPFGRGGMEVIAWDWYKNLDHDKFAVDFMGEALSDEKYMKIMSENGSIFFRVSKIKKNKNKLFGFLKKIKSISNIIKENNYDIVHIHATNAFGAFRYYIAAMPYCRHIIVHSHSTGIGTDDIKMDMSGNLRAVLHKICRLLMNNKKTVRLSCSEAAAEWMFPKKYKYTVVKNGINSSDFVFDENIRCRIRRELGTENKFVIGHVGRFSYAKNHVFLIDIFEEIHKKEPDSILLLVGSGSSEEHIKKKVRRARLEDSVIFYGSADNVNELYTAMDCFVFPSHFEGLGIAAVEAQAAGLRTFCSDGVPHEARITELSEYIPLSDSAEKWAEKILACKNGYERRNMSEEIKKTGWDIKISAKKLEALYLDLKEKS